jgi:phosphoglucomutase
MINAAARKIDTQPYSDQRPGTSGLRKKTRLFLQPNYIENFAQSVFDALSETGIHDFSKETLVLGGDGRFHNRAAIQIILKIAAGNGFGRILVGRGGLVSTPAMSAIIRRRSALGGLLLTASHNPGGIEADFGIKYNIQNGGPAPEAFTEKIYAKSRAINRFYSLDSSDIDIDRAGSVSLGGSQISVIDPLEDYVGVMGTLFDFSSMSDLFLRGFRLVFDAMHGITGIYAREIIEKKIGAPVGTVIRGTALEDFGGLHPDPNQVHAADLVQMMAGIDAPDMGAACDGDGDRNMILGRNLFVSPGDSLAIIAQHASDCIPGYSAGLAGVARSMPTSTAIDRVAAKLKTPCYETPTGWKFFGNLMDDGRCTICGEESFGTGSDHIREKDGVWAVLCWLAILAARRRSIEELVKEHWQTYGRSYYQRHDYEGLESPVANEVIDELRSKLHFLPGTALAGGKITIADDFQYTDPVDGSVSSRQGIRIILNDGSRIIGRLSGTGTVGATLRMYYERIRNQGEASIQKMLEPLIESSCDLFQIRSRLNRKQPTLIT